MYNVAIVTTLTTATTSEVTMREGWLRDNRGDRKAASGALS
jgi:hypothetical protein